MYILYLSPSHYSVTNLFYVRPAQSPDINLTENLFMEIFPNKQKLMEFGHIF